MSVNDKDWFKSTFEKSKDSVMKFTRSGKIRIEIASLKKRIDERYSSLGKKAFELMKDEEFDNKFLQEDFSAITDLESKIDELENEIQSLKNSSDAEADISVNENYIKTDSNRDDKKINQ